MFSRSKKRKFPLRTIAIYAVLVFFSLEAIFPVFILISRSFFSTDEITSIGAGIFPKTFTFDAYIDAFKDPVLLNGIKNTLIICLCSVIGVPLTAFMTAYAFTKVDFIGRKFWFTMGLCTIMIPGILLLLPVYKIFVDIGWYDTLLPLTVPSFFGGGIMNVFLIMQFLRGLPNDLYDAADIDGAGTFRKMFQISLPLVKPVIAYVAVGAFISSWNDIMRPLLYIQSEENYTINRYIYETYLITNDIYASAPNVQMAIGVVLMIPMIVIFIAFQKQLIEGIQFTGNK